MKHFVRYSLVRRITLFVLAVSAGSLLLHGVLLTLFIKPMADDMMARLAGQVSMARHMLANASPDHRADVVTALEAVGMRASRSRPQELGQAAAPFRPPRLPLATLPRIPEPALTLAHISRPPDPPFLSYETRIGTETWWISTNAAPVSGGSPLLAGAILVFLVGATGALTLVAGVRLITRPLSDLSLQLLSRCEQLTPIEPPPNASIELDRVIASFNQLVAAVGHANNVRRDMLAGLSHDLRTPLARLQLRIDCECQEDVARRLAPDFRALSHILSQFLAYAQGGIVSLGAAVAAGPVAQQIVDQFSATGQDVEFVSDGELDIALPELAIHRILSNLIDNALEHGQAPVRVRLTSTPVAVRIMVTDAGPGIPEHLFQQAQEPFAKLFGDQTNIGHCGLGLAIVAQITGQLGGRLVQARDGTTASIAAELPPQVHQTSCVDLQV